MQRKRNAPYASQAKRTKATTTLAKKTPKYRKYDSNPRSFVSLGRQFLPKMLKQTLRYFDMPAVSIAIGTGISTPYLFSCNGLYDPNVSGVGHQPMGFDNMMALYDHYTVVSSRLKVTLCNALTTADYPILLVAWIDDDGTATTSITTSVERPSSKLVVQAPGVAGPTPLFLSWSAREAFGPNPLSNDNLQGTSGANPTEVQNYAIQLYNAGATAISGCFLAVELEYDVIWDEIKDITGS